MSKNYIILQNIYNIYGFCTLKNRGEKHDKRKGSKANKI